MILAPIHSEAPRVTERRLRLLVAGSGLSILLLAGLIGELVGHSV